MDTGGTTRVHLCGTPMHKTTTLEPFQQTSAVPPLQSMQTLEAKAKHAEYIRDTSAEKYAEVAPREP